MSEGRWDVPESWAWTSAGELAQVVGGGTPPSKDETNFAEWGIPWITPADLTGYEEAYISRGRRDLSEKGYSSSGAQILPKETVLFSSRAPVGYCVIAANEVSTNQGFKNLVLEGGISPEFVRYYLLGSKDYAESMASGTTFLELSGARVAEMAVPVAPLPEQKRIVAKIDSLTARSARARADLSGIPALVTKYKARLLELATSGELTRQWRVENNPPQWSFSDVQKVAELVFDGPFGSNLKSADYSPSGVRVVRLENIGSLRFIREKETYIPEEKFEKLKRHELLPNDVLFSSFVAEEIRVCLFPRDLPTQAINKADCFCIRVNPSVCIPEFLAFRLASPATYEVLKQEVHGATRPRVSLGHLRAFGFDLPSLQEQAEIVHRIKTAFDWLDRISADHASASKHLLKLDAAVLAKAFRGELVPQHPDDEPATTLLDRIKAERAEKPRTRRARLPRKAKIKEKFVTLERNLEQVLIDADDWISAQTAFQRCGISDGASTEDIERIYAQLRDLDAAGKLEAEAVPDNQGRKLYDRIRLRAV